MSIKRREMKGWLYIFPALGLYLLLFVYSILFNIDKSFHRWNGFSDPQFIGFENYRYILTNDIFQSAFFHNLAFTVFGVTIMLVLSIGLAIMFNAGVKGSSFFRALMFLPVVIPMIVISLIWSRIYSPTGLLNLLLKSVGLGALARDWLGEIQTALPAVIVVWIWRHIGYGVLLIYAGVIDIPKEIEEAAVVDGASRRRIAWSITIPLLKPIIKTVAMLYIIWSFKVFTLIYATTGGGPYYATEVINTYMYRLAFEYGKLGRASTMATLVLLLMLTLGLIRKLVTSAKD